MPNSFDNYCYGSQAEAAVAEISRPAISGSSGVAVAVSYTSVNSTDVNMTYRYKPYSTSAANTYVLLRSYPSCSSVGYLTNYSGMNLADVISVSWLVVFCWVAAWSLKNLKRGISF